MSRSPTYSFCRWLWIQNHCCWRKKTIREWLGECHYKFKIFNFERIIKQTNMKGQLPENSNLIIGRLFMYTMRLHIKVNHLLIPFCISITISNRQRRGPILLIISSHIFCAIVLIGFRRLCCQILKLARFVTWKLKQEDWLNLKTDQDI